MSDCKNCAGGCGSCGGCAKELTLTQGELAILQILGQVAFLPVARKASEETPVYLEDDAYSKEEYSLILQCLEKKSLIRMDYDQPLKGADMSRYQGFPVHGSIALTQRGQEVLALLDTFGASE